MARPVKKTKKKATAKSAKLKPVQPPASAYFIEERHDRTESHTLSVVVDREPGVLARAIGLFSGRGYNIDSLTVSETEHAKHLSRITIVTTGTRMVIGQIRNQLERLVLTLEEDQKAGYFLGKDRRGSIHRIPLMTLSIGVVTNQFQEFTHTAQVSELAAEMKAYAKTLPGTVYVVDRRGTSPVREVS